MKIFHIVCMVLMIAMMQHTCLAEIMIIDLDNSKEWDAENQTIIIFNESSKTKLMTVELISAWPDLCTFTEIYEVRNFESYTPDCKADFNARTNTIVGNGAVTNIEWFIERNVSCVVNVTDYGIEQVEKEIYNNKTGKNETALVDIVVIVGYHDEIRYKDIWVDYRPYDKVMPKDQVQRIKVVYHKTPELGPFRIQTVPMFRGVECPELTWWSGSWDRRRAININNTYGDAVNNYQLVSVNLSSYNINAVSARIINDTSQLQESFWNETVDASGNLGYVWCNFSNISTGLWINSTYYIYYQSTPTESSIISGVDTFEFFEDVEDNDLSDWTTEAGATFTSVGSPVKHGSYAADMENTVDYGEAYKSVGTNLVDRIFEFDMRVPQNTLNKHVTIEKTGGDHLNGVYLLFRGTGNIDYYDGSWHTLQAYSINTWYHFKITTHPSADTFDIEIDDVDKGSGLGTRGSIVGGINAISFMGVSGGHLYTDSIFMRKYTVNEPEPWTVGSEEEYVAPTPTPTPTPVSTTLISPAQYDEMDLPLILYILMISLLYLLIAFRHGVAAVELSFIYLIFAFFFLLFQTVTMSVNYIYLTLFLLLFMISIAGITKQGVE